MRLIKIEVPEQINSKLMVHGLTSCKTFHNVRQQ